MSDIPLNRADQIAAASGVRGGGAPPSPMPKKEADDADGGSSLAASSPSFSSTSPGKTPKRKKKKKIVFVNPLNPNNPKRKKAIQQQKRKGQNDNNVDNKYNGNRNEYRQQGSPGIIDDEDSLEAEDEKRDGGNKKSKKKKRKNKKFGIVGRIKGRRGGKGKGGGGGDSNLEITGDSIENSNEFGDDDINGSDFMDREPSSSGAFSHNHRDFNPLDPPGDVRRASSKKDDHMGSLLQPDPDIMMDRIVEVENYGDDTITGEEDDQFDVEAINLNSSNRIHPRMDQRQEHPDHQDDDDDDYENDDQNFRLDEEIAKQQKKQQQRLLPFVNSEDEDDDYDEPSNSNIGGGDHSEGSGGGGLGGKAGRRDSMSTVPISGPISLILLLVEQGSLRFELLQLEFETPQTASVKDVLVQIKASVTEPVLRQKKFVGVMDRLGRSYGERTPLGDALTKRRNNKDILVVVCQGVSAEQSGRLARPILGDEKVIGMVSFLRFFREQRSTKAVFSLNPTSDFHHLIVRTIQLTLHGYDVTGWAKDKKNQSKINDSQRKDKKSDGKQLLYILMAGIAFVGSVLMYMTYQRLFVRTSISANPSTTTTPSVVNNSDSAILLTTMESSEASPLHIKEIEKDILSEHNMVSFDSSLDDSNILYSTDDILEQENANTLDLDAVVRVAAASATIEAQIVDVPPEIRQKAEEEARIIAEFESFERLKAEEEARVLAEKEAARLKAELAARIKADEEEKAARLLSEAERDREQEEARLKKALEEETARLSKAEQEKQQQEKNKIETSRKIPGEIEKVEDEAVIDLDQEVESPLEPRTLGTEGYHEVDEKPPEERAAEEVKPDWQVYAQSAWAVTKTILKFIQSWVSYFIFGKEQEPDLEKQGWISYLIFGKAEVESMPEKQGWISRLIFGAPKELENGNSILEKTGIKSSEIGKGNLSTEVQRKSKGAIKEDTEDSESNTSISRSVESAGVEIETGAVDIDSQLDAQKLGR